MAIVHYVLVKWGSEGRVWRAIDEGRHSGTITYHTPHHSRGIYVYFNTEEDMVEFKMKWL